MYTVLVCDDDRDIVSALEIYLKGEGYRVLKAYNGEEALLALQENEAHLVLLDVMMPGTDGIEALTQLRESFRMPVIFLTAKSEDTDIILGLNLGADDYVTKPFNPVELLARVRSQLRRYTQLGSRPAEAEVLQVGPISINDAAKTVTVDGEEVNLTPTEYEILKLLASHPGQVFPPAEIYRRVWKDEPYGADSTVAVHIRHLREKTEIDPTKPRYIKVAWGQGYKIEP